MGRGLCLLAGVLLAVCGQRETEPLTIGAVPAPCLPAQVVCGMSQVGDTDVLKVPLDYHTTMFAEGAMRMQVRAEMPVPLRLTVLGPNYGGPAAGYHVVGTWSGTYHIDTGVFTVDYYPAAGLDHVLAFTQVGWTYPTAYAVSYQ